MAIHFLSHLQSTQSINKTVFGSSNVDLIEKMKLIKEVLCLSFLFVVVLCQKNSSKISRVEERLITGLLANLTKYARPVRRNDKPVLVDFQLKLGKLVTLDIKSQVMVGNFRVLMRWFNPHLTWDKNDYNGTDYINLPSNLLWTPDVMLHNSALKQSQSTKDVYKTHVLVKSTGVAIWMSPVTLEASCSMNVKWFPFDRQVCTLEFGSRSYTKKKITLRFFRNQPKGLDVMDEKHHSSGHWTMENMTSDLHEEYFECCTDPFSVIKYEFVWRRLTMYWLLYLVFPCICLSFLALFVFFIPSETGERTGFGITAVLAMSVYLLVISDKLPEKSDESPVIGVLYTILFFLMFGTLLAVIITTHLSFKTSQPPDLLKKILRIHRSASGRREKPASSCKKSSGWFKKVLHVDKSGDRQIKPSSLPDSAVVKCKNVQSYRNFRSEDEDREKESLEVIELQKETAMNRHEDNPKLNKSYGEEWREIAQKLDVWLFRFFLGATIFALSVALMSYYA